MKTLITIEYSTDNASFKDYPDQERRMLLECMESVMRGNDTIRLRDDNGNVVGSCTVEDKKEPQEELTKIPVIYYKTEGQVYWLDKKYPTELLTTPLSSTNEPLRNERHVIDYYSIEEEDKAKCKRIEGLLMMEEQG